LLTDRNIPLTTIQSKSGTGKSLLSLASALYMTFEKKLYNKIIIIKSSAESSEYIGYRPGNVEQKMEPI
jgi:PhoH-like ATPase